MKIDILILEQEKTIERLEKMPHKSLLAEYEIDWNDNKDNINGSDILYSRMLAAILSYQQLDMEQRLKKLKSDLPAMKQQRTKDLIIFEKTSREVNLNFTKLIETVDKICKNKDTESHRALKDWCVKYKLEKDSMSQEDKNDLYFDIKSRMAMMR